MWWFWDRKNRWKYIQNNGKTNNDSNKFLSIKLQLDWFQNKNCFSVLRLAWVIVGVYFLVEYIVLPRLLSDLQNEIHTKYIHRKILLLLATFFNILSSPISVSHYSGCLHSVFSVWLNEAWFFAVIFQCTLLFARCSSKDLSRCDRRRCWECGEAVACKSQRKTKSHRKSLKNVFLLNYCNLKKKHWVKFGYFLYMFLKLRIRQCFLCSIL